MRRVITLSVLVLAGCEGATLGRQAMGSDLAGSSSPNKQAAAASIVEHRTAIHTRSARTAAAGNDRPAAMRVGMRVR